MRFPDDCQHINLFMTGHIGSGKSCFANTLKTVFEDTGEIASPAVTYGIDKKSETRKVKKRRGKNILLKMNILHYYNKNIFFCKYYSFMRLLSKLMRMGKAYAFTIAVESNPLVMNKHFRMICVKSLVDM